MNSILWILQFLIAGIFMFSGINKSIFSEQKLIAKGQTGVVGLPLPLIRFIGVSEILGAIGIILPLWLNILPILTTISAICFAIIMIPAAIIHYRLGEPKNIFTNCVIFLLCIFIAYCRAHFSVWSQY